jgi:glycosyltransferase involved in cell wall biosynthesis
MSSEPTLRAVSKKRILYVDSAPTLGGSVLSLYELLKHLDRSQYEPTVVFYARHANVADLTALGLDVIVWDVYGTGDHRPGWAIKARGSFVGHWLQQSTWGARAYHSLGFALLLARRVWPRARALRRIIDQRQINLVHSNIRVGHDREAILAAQMAGIPCVCHIRDFERLNWFDRQLAARAGACIYISQAVQRSHLEAGVGPEKGHVVYNGVDWAAFSAACDVQQARRSFGVGGCGPVVGIVGRLEPWKGQHVFLKAMAVIRDRLPQARGIVIGDPVPYDMAYRDQLLTLRDELGLSEQVTFCGFRKDLPMVMAALDVLVLASISPEPFGRVLIEAMAAAKPVVATDAGAAREIVDHGVEGLLVPAEDAQALAGAVAQLLSDPDLARTMGQRGRATVRERFGVQQYVDGVQAVYRQLL